MASAQTGKQSEPPKSEKPFDELISELITQRKIQQDALLKIKASVAKRQVGSVNDQANEQPERTPKPKQ